MKIDKISIYIIITLISVMNCSVAMAKKEALLIGISEYNSKDIIFTSAKNDLDILSSELSQRGWNITTLYNDQANKDSILLLIKQYCETLSKGDQFILYFSGHGAQLIDCNGDEADGLDECLVLYNGNMNLQKDSLAVEKIFVDDGYWVDDEINIVLNRIRERVGSNGSVGLLVDACFSGTVHKGVVGGKIRQLPKLLESNGNNRSAMGEMIENSSDQGALLYSATASSSNSFAFETDKPMRFNDTFGYFGIFTISICTFVDYLCLSKQCKNTISKFNRMIETKMYQLNSNTKPSFYASDKIIE